MVEAGDLEQASTGGRVDMDSANLRLFFCPTCRRGNAVAQMGLPERADRLELRQKRGRVDRGMDVHFLTN